MNPVRLQQVLSELEAQKDTLRNQYHQAVGAAAIVKKILAEFPTSKEADSNTSKD